MNKRRLILFTHVLVIVIASLNFLAYSFFWYWKYWWFDMVMHFLGGLWVGLFTLWWHFSHEGKKLPDAQKEIEVIFLSLFFVLFVGVLWEAFEFSVDTVITVARHDFFDTLSDIFFDACGAIAAAITFLLVYNEKTR